MQNQLSSDAPFRIVPEAAALAVPLEKAARAGVGVMSLDSKTVGHVLLLEQVWSIKDAGHRRRETLAELVVQWSDGSWDDGITEDGRRFANELEAGGFSWRGQKYNFAWLDRAEADGVLRAFFS